MTPTHRNIHQFERPTGQEDATRHRVLAVMLDRTNPLPTRRRGTRFIDDAATIAMILVLLAGLWLMFGQVVRP